VAHGMRVTCPNCGFGWTVPVVLQEVTFVGAGGIIVATTCSLCGYTFDATDGREGTYSIETDGRLRLREAVFEASAAIFSRPIPRADIEAAIQVLRRRFPTPHLRSFKNLRASRRSGSG
jgi:hypothetical protein